MPIEKRRQVLHGESVLSRTAALQSALRARTRSDSRKVTAGKPSFLGHLMQTMSDQTACPLKKLQVFVVEGIQFIALGIEHAENVPVIVAHRHNDLGTSRMKRR